MKRRNALAEGRLGWLRGLTIAHRGLHDIGMPGQGWAENSPSAFAAAIRAGLAIECDVQLTADGEAAVFHDFTLDRLTHVKGPLAAHPASVLARIPIAATRDTIPMLGDVLRQIGGQVPLLIEIKIPRKQAHAPLCRAVAFRLDGYEGPLAVMSFDARVPRWFAAEAPDIARGLVLDRADLSGWRAWWLGVIRLRRSKAEFLAVDVRGLPSKPLAKWREKLPIATWTVRRAVQREIALAHADALIVEGDGLQ